MKEKEYIERYTDNDVIKVTEKIKNRKFVKKII